jgi:molecular chaperone GrpE
MQKEHIKSEAPTSGGEGETAQAMTPESVEQQLTEALAERDANYDRFLRTQAEFDNYRKRAQREMDEERKFAPLPIVRDLLPVLDNLRRATDAARAANEPSNLVQGIDLVLQQVEQVLARYGVTPIPAVGESFNPHLHEALTQMPSAEHPPMTVLQELERGYKLHDRVVRPGKVIVSQAVQ